MQNTDEHKYRKRVHVSDLETLVPNATFGIHGYVQMSERGSEYHFAIFDDGKQQEFGMFCDDGIKNGSVEYRDVFSRMQKHLPLQEYRVTELPQPLTTRLTGEELTRVVRALFDEFNVPIERQQVVFDRWTKRS